MKNNDVTITLTAPHQINSGYMKLGIKEFMGKGYSSTQIKLELNFICDEPEKLFKKFQVIKNKIFFENS